MIIKNRIPMTALQTALYSILTAGQSTPVYDDVPAEAALPYITFGAFTWKPGGAKGINMGEASLQLHIFSAYNGKKEVNNISDDVTTVISATRLNLSASGFDVLSQSIDMVEAFPEEDSDGYHGVITFIAKIQDLGGK